MFSLYTALTFRGHESFIVISKKVVIIGTSESEPDESVESEVQVENCDLLPSDRTTMATK